MEGAGLRVVGVRGGRSASAVEGDCKKGWKLIGKEREGITGPQVVEGHCRDGRNWSMEGHFKTGG